MLKMSSACTGAYTAEMAGSLVLHVINQSGKLWSQRTLQSVYCVVAGLNLGQHILICFFGVTGVLYVLD